MPYIRKEEHHATKTGSRSSGVSPLHETKRLHCLRISSNNILYEIARFASRNFSKNSLLVRGHELKSTDNDYTQAFLSTFFPLSELASRVVTFSSRVNLS